MPQVLDVEQLNLIGFANERGGKTVGVYPSGAEAEQVARTLRQILHTPKDLRDVGWRAGPGPEPRGKAVSARQRPQ